MKQKLLALGAFMVIASSALAQQGLQRRANVVGGGGPDYGKCTVEVVVDGGAQVEIRGDTATLRDTNGQTPQWRRFECTSPLPPNPANFRFAGVDGRGNQTLVRDPRNGGAAVVQIADPQGGSEGYTFDIFWGNDRGSISQDRRGDQPYRDGSPSFDRGGDRYGDRGGNRFTAEQAVRVCQDYITAQANDRFRGQVVQMGRLSMDNNPGRNDWVLGDLAVRRRFGRQDTYRFNCSVNFATGQLRTAHIDQFPANSYR